MTGLSLVLDDPLKHTGGASAGAQDVPPVPTPPQDDATAAAAGVSATPARAAGAPSAEPQPAAEAAADTDLAVPSQDAGRYWEDGIHTATYRLPVALLTELTRRSNDLATDKGTIVTAALLAALDLDDRELLAAAERVEDAKREAGRQRRRRTR